MVKHTQTIRRQTAEELFECVWPFCGVDAKDILCISYFSKTLEAYRNLSKSTMELFCE